jgi:hypothetical protein
MDLKQTANLIAANAASQTHKWTVKYNEEIDFLSQFMKTAHKSLSSSSQNIITALQTPGRKRKLSISDNEQSPRKRGKDEVDEIDTFGGISPIGEKAATGQDFTELIKVNLDLKASSAVFKIPRPVSAEPQPVVSDKEEDESKEVDAKETEAKDRSSRHKSLLDTLKNLKPKNLVPILGTKESLTSIAESSITESDEVYLLCLKYRVKRMRWKRALSMTNRSIPSKKTTTILMFSWIKTMVIQNILSLLIHLLIMMLGSARS